MNPGREAYYEAQFLTARQIYEENGADGLLNFLYTISYGSGDSACACELNEISSLAQLHSSKGNGELYKRVKTFINNWDMLGQDY